MKIKGESNKDYTSLDIGEKFCISFNQRLGWAFEIAYKNDGFSKSIEFVFFKPSIMFIYWLPRARGL